MLNLMAKVCSMLLRAGGGVRLGQHKDHDQLGERWGVCGFGIECMSI